MTYFNFEDSNFNSVPDFTSDQPPGTQSSTLTNFTQSGGGADFTTAGIALNVAPGDADPNNFSMGVNSPAGSTTTIRFGASTLSLMNFSLSFAIRDDPSITLVETASYSLDGGATFNPLLSQVQSSSGSAIKTFTYPSAVDNQASPVFFQVSVTDVGAGTAFALDNIQLTVPEPSTWAVGLLTAGALLCSIWRRDAGRLRHTTRAC